MTYNGHPTYEHWNVSLWTANDEGLYRFIVGGCTPEELQEVYPVTGDGVEVTRELAAYAIECICDEESDR